MSDSVLTPLTTHSVVVCGVDPGTTNAAFWIGEVDVHTTTIRTLSACRGTGMASAPRSRRPAVIPTCAAVAQRIADECRSRGVTRCIVETAPFWNTLARVSSAVIYGVLVGRGLQCVMSNPRTKADAIEAIANAYDIPLHTPAARAKTTDKKAGEARRRINKQNAIMAAERVMMVSGDDEGQRLLQQYHDKRDDVCDAMLLALGYARSVADAGEEHAGDTHVADEKKGKRRRVM